MLLADFENTNTDAHTQVQNTKTNTTRARTDIGNVFG